MDLRFIWEVASSRCAERWDVRGERRAGMTPRKEVPFPEMGEIRVRAFVHACGGLNRRTW